MNTTDNIIDGLDEIEIANTPVDEIETENVNLMFIGIDCSGSMSLFSNEMTKSLNEFKNAIENSKEADEILIARADFDACIKIGGYKKIDQFETDFCARGMTALYDVIQTGTEKLIEYKKYLKDQGMRVKSVFAIFSDGEDTYSTIDLNQAKDSITMLNNEEIVTAFISFGGSSADIAKQLGFKNILSVTSNASELRKAFDCLSKSAISASKSVTAPVDNFFV